MEGLMLVEGQRVEGTHLSSGSFFYFPSVQEEEAELLGDVGGALSAREAESVHRRDAGRKAGLNVGDTSLLSGRFNQSSTLCLLMDFGEEKKSLLFFPASSLLPASFVCSWFF